MNKKEVLSGELGYAIGMSLALIISFFVVPWLVQLLWNALLPELFGLTSITYWQAVGINVLCGILFGNRGSGLNDKN